MDSQAAASGIGSILCCGVGAVIMIPLLGFWIWMLIDVIKRVPSENNQKLIWLLVLIFGGFIGAIIYYFVQRPKNPPLGPPTA